ncbi:MAG: hypothetical protein C0483_24670 [Pirellula sp.]|nr:hypothetical protein [Pirellula sp.]
MCRQTLSVAVGCALAVFVAAPLEAAVGFRQLTTAVPCAVQVGQKATVQLRSNFTLDGTYQSFFVPAGPTMRLLETKPIEAPLTGRGRPGTPFKFEVSVPSNQMPGLHEFRLATPQAVSSVASLLITEYPVVLETSKENGTRERAEPVAVPSAVCGVCDPSEDVDCYRFAGKSGERLTFQIYAQRITQSVHDMVGKSGYHMDPILTLLSPTGQVVAMNDNYFGGDALLTAEIAQDGEYVLAVRDTRYGGDVRYSYCVEISRGLPAVATFPLVIERGKATELEVLSAAGQPLGKTKVSPAKDAEPGIVREPLLVDGIATNPASYGVAAVPQLVQEATNTQQTSRDIQIPCGINGRLPRDGDEHWYAFEAKKDAYYLLAAESRKFRLPLDVVLEIYDAKGKKLGEADDLPLTPDAKQYFKSPADGPLLLRVRDVNGRGGPDFLYHLRVEPSGPDFELTGKLYYAMVAPGTRALWFINAVRHNGFAGPIEIHVDGLPAGVRQVPVTIPAGMNYAPIVLEADKSAKVAATLVKITGRAQLDEAGKSASTEIVREAVVTCELQSQGGSQGHWPVQSSLVGVVEKLDLLSVEASPSELTLKPGSKAELQVSITRNPAYKDPVGLEFTWQYFGAKLGEQLPPGVTLAKGSAARLSGNTLTGKMTLEASKDALQVERFPIAVMAGVSVSFSIDTKYASNPVYLTIPAATKSTDTAAGKSAEKSAKKKPAVVTKK